MDLELNCDHSGYDNVRFSRRGTRGLVVGVTRSDEESNILLSDKDVERLYEYIGEYIGKGKESVPEVSTKSTEEVSDLLSMKFRCTADPYDTFETSFDSCDDDLYINVKNEDEVSAIYLSSEDALTLAKNIIKAFESVGIEAEPVVKKTSLSKDEAEPVVNEYEAASKEDLDKVVIELKELKEDFHSSMEDVVNKLNKDINQVHVEISQIQNDIFNTNEHTKVKLERLGKHTESVSKEVVAAMEHIATRIDENGEEIHLLKVRNDIRAMKGDSIW